MEIFHLPFLGNCIELEDHNTDTIDLLLVPSCGEKNHAGETIYDFNKNVWKNAQKFMDSMSCELVTYLAYTQGASFDYDIPSVDDEFDNDDTGM